MLSKRLQELHHCRVLLRSEEARVKISIFQLHQISCHTPIKKLFRDFSELRSGRLTQCDLSGLKKTDDLFAGLEGDCTIAKPRKAGNCPSPCSWYIVHLLLRLQTSGTRAVALSEHRAEGVFILFTLQRKPPYLYRPEGQRELGSFAKSALVVFVDLGTCDSLDNGCGPVHSARSPGWLILPVDGP